MDQDGSAPQSPRVGNGTITGTDQSGPEYSQEAINHANSKPRPQESNELALARIHNAALPIHTLPAEVLLQIFRLQMLELLDLIDYYTQLLSLSRVCSHWYNLSRDSPPLWTRVSLSDPPGLVEMALQRPACHPLDIIIGIGPFPAPHDIQKFMHTISPHSDRWRSMDIRVPNRCMESITEALGEPLPNLEKLTFQDSDTISCSEQYDLFGGKAPRLTTCTLDGVSIRWDSEVLHDLTVLDISWVHFSSTDSILHILSHSPQLYSLRIHHCGTGALASSSSPSVQLAQLACLYVDLSPEGATENFLDHIISDVKNAFFLPSY